MWVVNLLQKCKSLPIKLSRLVNSNNREANMGTIRVATMISELIEHGLWFFTYTNMIWEIFICILVACGMRHGRLYFILLCYMVVSPKECMDVWSARLLLSSHSAQNPLDMDNDWMYANLGITKSVESMFNSGINQYVEHLEI